MLGAGLLVCSETTPPSCGNSLIGLKFELFLLENLLCPMEEKTEPELKPGLSTFFSVVWQEQGRSVSSVRGQGPGASRPIQYIPDFHSLEQLQSPRCPGSHHQSAHSFHTGPSCSKRWYFKHLVTLNSISDTGSLVYLALARPLRSVAPVTVGPDPTTQK